MRERFAGMNFLQKENIEIGRCDQGDQFVKLHDNREYPLSEI